MMVIADSPRNLPSPILPLPEMDELSFTHPLRILVPGMMEPMHASLEHPL